MIGCDRYRPVTHTEQPDTGCLFLFSLSFICCWDVWKKSHQIKQKSLYTASHTSHKQTVKPELVQDLAVSMSPFPLLLIKHKNLIGCSEESLSDGWQAAMTASCWQLYFHFFYFAFRVNPSWRSVRRPVNIWHESPCTVAAQHSLTLSSGVQICLDTVSW